MSTAVTPSLLFTFVLVLMMACFNMAGLWLESALEYSRTMIWQSQYWRLLTANFVHYGFIHLAMNSAALVLIGFTLLRELSVKLYSALLVFAALSVTLGITLFNPELEFYRGFSGVLHALLVAGLLLNRARNPWVCYFGLLLIIGKLIHEHTPGFHDNQLHNFLPVMVAVDSHFYGAIAGLVFAAMIIAGRYFVNAKRNPI